MRKLKVIFHDPSLTFIIGSKYPQGFERLGEKVTPTNVLYQLLQYAVAEDVINNQYKSQISFCGEWKKNSLITRNFLVTILIKLNTMYY